MANGVTDSTYKSRAHWYWKSTCSVLPLEEKEEWTKYSDIESQIIEEAFCVTNKTELIELEHYWINLNDSIQINKNDKNEQTQIKRVIINTNEDQATAERLFLPGPRYKPFNDSGLEGGIAFIYDWKKRNATLSNSEIVIQAANGIIVEGNQLGKHQEAQRVAQQLIVRENENEDKILECCIRLYTFECFLYRLVNKVLRESDKTKIETLAPFCYFLTEAIWGNVLAHQRFKAAVYRGTELDSDSIRRYQEAVGTYKCWYGFTSTSRNRDVAEFYGGNVLFIIDASCTGALDVSSYSQFPDEEEVILSPATTFRIDKVERRDTKTYIYVFVVPEVRMVLLGRTGTGKSSFGNTILRKKEFKARKSARSITTKCGVGDRIFDNRRLVVVDTPGFFDTELSPEIIIPEISGSHQIAAPGPDVFLVVLTFDRFTPQEEAAAKWISEVFDERALDYCIIVFTGLDNLKGDEITVEEFLEDAPAFLQNLIQKCNGRYIAVDNTANDDEKEETVKILLDKISTMVQKNGGQFYNNKQFMQIATVLEKHQGWFDPLRPDGTVNLLPEIQNIVVHGLVDKTIFSSH